MKARTLVFGASLLFGLCAACGTAVDAPKEAGQGAQSGQGGDESADTEDTASVDEDVTALSCGHAKHKCGSKCVNLKKNANHCGACGNHCGSGNTCVAGSCQPSCPAPQVRCGSACVDTTSTTTDCGACGHDCLGGACTDGVCQPVTLASGLDDPYDLATDGTTVWFHALGATNALLAVPAAGGDATTFDAASPGGPILVDANNVYVVEGYQQVVSIPHAGGTPAVVAQGGFDFNGLALCGGSLCYFQRGAYPYHYNDITLFQVATTGGTPATLSSLTGVMGGAIYRGPTTAYFAQESGTDGQNMVITALPTGTPVTLPGVTYVLGVDDANAYTLCGDTVQDLCKTPLSGGAAVTLFSLGSSTIPVLVSDGTDVYIGTQDTGVLETVPVAGGTPRVLASGLNYVGSIALDAHAVYFTRSNDGILAKVAK
jgi:hypothetical protein